MAAERTGLRKWLWEQRNASRLAYLLHLSTRVFSSFFALFWINLLVGAMGKPLYDRFLGFQSIFSFGGLGDLGMGGVVGIRTGQHLGAGQSKLAELQKFLASARTIFLTLGLTAGLVMVSLSSFLPGWLHWPETDTSGPLAPVFVMGGLVMALVLFSSYLNNLNYACGNVTWPVLPDLLLLQLSLLGHWWLAHQQESLWIQYIPYVAASIARLGIVFLYVRTSHPDLGKLLPLGFDRRMILSLFEGSFWLYLCSLGNSIYRNTDSLLIVSHAGFARGTLTDYVNNYKFCELATFICLTASYVSLPKITQWMASTEPKDQERVRIEMRRLNQFQTLLGCGAALAYLAGNNFFIRLWMMRNPHPVTPVALTLQLAFALNLAVTASGDAGIQLAMRSGKSGMRVAGTVIGLTGLLNLSLSYVAMKQTSLLGIAMATVLAQSVLSLIASRYVCRHLKIDWLPWILKGWLVPLVGICFAAWLRMLWPMDSILHIVALVTAYATMLALAAWGLGISLAFIRDELKIVQKFFGK